MKKIKSRRPHMNENGFILFPVCDPVLGDDQSYYVPPELSKEYRDKLIPLCEILTPNQFELGELSGMPVKTETEAIKVI